MVADVLAETRTHYVTNHVTAGGEYDGFDVIDKSTGQIVAWSWWYKTAVQLMLTGQFSKVREAVRVLT